MSGWAKYVAPILLALLGLGLAKPAQAVVCSNIDFQDMPYTVCEVSADENLRLWLYDKDQTPFGSFQAIDDQLNGPTLIFAMNAGMYHKDRRPVGLYLENGDEYGHLSDGGGYGNFGLLPNGVLCIGDQVRVWESTAFAAQQPACRFATQSGPMLVIDGALHPRFLQDSTSRYIRNAVGTSADGKRAVFAISNRPVSFWDMAVLYRDYLKLPDALFLDGNVSRLYAPDLGRADGGRPMGPIVGVVD